MQTLAPKYDPHAVENKWYEYWMKHRLFHSVPDEREPYTIVIPPPNVTGVLHMGHILNNTIQDILVRRARMLGKNALWVPGTDHAAIATETKVIAKLAAEGIKKTDLTREQFLEHAWDWTKTHGGIILQQLRTLGASCDWDRTAFTLDEERSKAVVKVFCDLYDKGLIYRGLRMVNWDPKNKTAISDDEVIYEQENSKLYYLRYYVKDDAEKRYAVVATTRPETIMGDTAMCINPKDPKNEWLKGKTVIVPLVGREIPVIEDRYVDIEFGTGCLKVTPAHDKNDNMLGKTHNLDSIDIFNEDATLNEHGGKYAGMDRFDCRKQIAKDLEEAGLMEKTEDYVNNVGYSERTKVAIEPRLSLQWFVKMKHFADIAMGPVADDIIKFVPTKYKNTYRIWLENIQDWCISRQLWWGHRIPAWYFTGADGEESFVVAHDAEEALVKASEAAGKALTPADIRQDEGALDTWFSSWLWPITLFDGIMNPGNEEINYYYPTATLVTGPDIIFFWVARMIMAGYEYVGKQPFNNVYFTGIVRDKIGRKMSKSLGNSPDPLDLIATYGADGVRMGMMLAAPAGNDIMYDDSLCEQGRNFCNKMWNAFRLVKGWETAEIDQPAAAREGLDWMRAKLQEAVNEVDDLMSKFRISEALMTLFKLFRDEFSGWLLEVVKPAFGQPIDKKTYEEVLSIFDSLLRLLHPFMPFITEELWQHLAERKDGESIMYAQQPKVAELTDEERSMIARFEAVKEVIAGVRTVRKDRGIKTHVPLAMFAKGEYVLGFEAALVKMAVLSAFEAVQEIPEGPAQGFMVDAAEYAVSLEGLIDEAAEAEKKAKERAKALEEIAYQEKFLAGVEKKLSNERFVANAPEAVVALERKKRDDALARIAALKATV